MNYYNVFVPEHYLYEMPLDVAIVYFFIETMLLNNAEHGEQSSINRFVLDEVIYEGFIFVEEDSGILDYLIKNDYLCVIETLNGEHITLGSSCLHL